MLNNSDIHVTFIRRTYAKDQNNQVVPGYELNFTIRGQGNYTVVLPVQDYSLEVAMRAIAAVATPIIETLDTFKGS